MKINKNEPKWRTNLKTSKNKTQSSLEVVTKIKCNWRSRKDTIEVHLPKSVLRHYGLVQGIPPPCDIESVLRLISRKNQGTTNWTEIIGRHIARWDHRLELLAQGAPIDAVGAPSTRDYMLWFLSITRRWMTPRSIIVAAHYATAAPTMTQFVSFHSHLND